MRAASHHGIVVGGAPLSTGDGYYYILVPDSGDGAQLKAAIRKLSALPQVEMASLSFRIIGPTGSRIIRLPQDDPANSGRLIYAHDKGSEVSSRPFG